MVALQCLEGFLSVVGECIGVDMENRIAELRRCVDRNQGDIDPAFRVVGEDLVRAIVPGHFFTFLREDLQSGGDAWRENRLLCDRHVEYQIARGGRGNMFN